MSLTREQILSAADIKTVVVPTPEWGDEVYVRTLSGADRDALESDIRADKDAGTLGLNARARFCVAFASDSAGVPLFTIADIAAVSLKSAVVLDRIWNAGRKLNALSEADVEDKLKNSAPDLSANSTSTSH
jgi:hypothetical protein